MSALARSSTPVAKVSPIPWRPPAPHHAVRTGVVVIGTAATIRQVVAAIDTLPDRPVLAGAILLGHSTGGLDIPGLPVLGELADLAVLAPRLNLRLALVCLPAAMPGRDAALAAVGSSGLPVREWSALGDVLSPPLPAPAPANPTANPSANPPAGAPAQPARHHFAGPTPRVDLGRLIGREPYEMDVAAVAKVITGKRVLITGAGGSIGSELARVAAGLEPELLVLMERGENALFEIDRQIARHFPRVQRKAVLHDVVDAEATMRACAAIAPHAVFHAAAHKHVPLMEDHPAHAVSNNVFGTKSIADAARACGAERFVLISSDKAVNPTSVMGATKRLAEMYVQSLASESGYPHAPRGDSTTRLSMVRFGNVLGSSASVLTIWAQQIAEGGPLTITDPRMTRYFMTIPEAATLVVQSTTLDAPGAQNASAAGVFVLDMGQPIRIVDLAIRFAQAHGLSVRRLDTPEPEIVGQGPSIDLVTTGIRPGEKLHEELAYAAEQLLPTTHPGVRAWGGPGLGRLDERQACGMIADLHAARFAQDRAAVIAAIRAYVPEMRTAADSCPESGVVGHGHRSAG
jgi:FlaA1/EpsC-like NDP-sugar epimerase